MAYANGHVPHVHLKTISIRHLHLEIGRWVRHAASRGPIVVTDRGRRVAALQPFDVSMIGRPLPNREAAIRKRSKVPDVAYIAKCYLNQPGADRVSRSCVWRRRPRIVRTGTIGVRIDPQATRQRAPRHSPKA